MSTRILVIDNGSATASLLNQHFQPKIQAGDYHFCFAASGPEALAQLQSEPVPDMLLLDLCLPDVDGLTLLRQVPALLPHGRVIILAAHRDLGTLRTTANHGLFDFVCKPLAFADLTAIIEKTAHYIQQLRAAQVVARAEGKAQLFDTLPGECSAYLTLMLAPLEKLLRAVERPAPACHNDMQQVARYARHLLHLLNQWLEGTGAAADPVGLPPAALAAAPLLLLIDNHAELRASLVRQLATDYRLLTAADGLSGWQLVQLELPDVVVVDVATPGLDGYELRTRIKNTPATAHIAVLLTIARAPGSEQQISQHLENEACLAKPCGQEELRGRLRYLLADQPRRLLARPPAPTLAPGSVREQWLGRLYELLEQHLDKSDLSVEWLATQLLMSRKTLLRKLQVLLQLTPSEVIQQYRLRRAADLLRAGYHVAEAAYAVGFNTPAYFGQCFKEFYLVTPSQFAAAALRPA